MITAIVLINTDQGHTVPAAEALAEIPGVAEVYSVAGEYDAVIRRRAPAAWCHRTRGNGPPSRV